MNEDPWDRYRRRVEGDSSVARRLGYYRWVSHILACYGELDSEIGRKVRTLPPADYAVLVEVLGMMQQKEGGPDLAGFFSGFLADLGGGSVTEQRWQATDRVYNLVGLAQRAEGHRLVAPALASPLGAGEGVAPAAVAASGPLFDRYGQLVARLVAGRADGDLDASLAALLADLKNLRDHWPAGGASWRHVQWGYAIVVGALARSAALQGHVTPAIERFQEAAAAWGAIGEDASRQDCLVRGAQIALEDGADVDQALESIMADLDRTAGSTTLRRAELLARCAELYLSVSSYFDASDQVAEAVAILTGLGFTDPSAAGVDAAFSDWVDSSWTEDLGLLADNKTMGLLSTVATIWTTLIGVQVILPSERSRATALSQALGGLAALTNRMGQVASDVGTGLAMAAAQAGIGPLLPPPRGAVPDGGGPDGGGQGWGVPGDGVPGDGEPDGSAPGDRVAAASAPAVSSLDLAERIMALQDAANNGDPNDPSYLDLVPAAEAVESQARAARLPQLAATASSLRADVLLALQRFQAAADALAEAEAHLQASDMAEATRRTLSVELLKRQALAYAMLHDDAQVSDTCGAAIAEVEHDRGKVSAPFLQDSYLRDRRRLYDMGVFSAWKLEDYPLMLARAELAKARGILGLVGARDQRTLGSSLEKEFRSLSDAAGGGAEGGQLPPVARARRQALWTRFMMARGHAQPPEFDLPAIQKALDQDEAVVYYYWLARQVLLVITVDSGNVEVEKVSFDTDERDALARLVSDLLALEGAVTLLDDQLRAVSGRLLPQKAGEILQSKRRLILSPHGILHQLPFSALWWEGKRLVDSFALRYVPNLTSLLLPDGTGDEVGVLSVGISEFDDPSQNLPRSADEARAIAALYQAAGVSATPLIDADARRAKVMALDDDGRLGRFRTLHIATHGDSVAPDDLFSARLRLYDGSVDGLDIGHWRLGADLVVLSACYLGQQAIAGRHRPASSDPSGGPPVDEELFGDEVFGLQAALFAAGARQVLGALWRADDEASESIMTGVHAALLEGRPADVALQRAILEYRATNDWPSSWAPYKLISLGRPGRGKFDSGRQ